MTLLNIRNQKNSEKGMLEIEILFKLKYCPQTLYFVEFGGIFTQRVDTSAKTHCIGLEKDKNNTCNKRLWTGYETDQNAGLLWKLESLKCWSGKLVKLQLFILQIICSFSFSCLRIGSSSHFLMF